MPTRRTPAQDVAHGQPGDDSVWQSLSALRSTVEKVGAGTALLFDRQGRVQAGAAVNDAHLEHCTRLALRCAASGLPVSEVDPLGSETWAFAVAGFVLVLCNSDLVQREQRLYGTLRTLLPQIAKVVNGEAIIFDDGGRLVHTALPDGRPSPNAHIRHESLPAVLDANRPEVASSRWVPGATAVRLPLTRRFGFAFNNALAVQVGRQLVEEERQRPTARYSWDDVVGTSPAIAAAREQARVAARSRSPVLIQGESGTGKELFAQAIHNASSRARGPFISINCGALTSTLVESLLFGYVDGAFTGARKGGQVGLFERASGGSLLLDEISELEIDLQVKLLRVLQEGEVLPVGAHAPRAVDVRIIGTSNRDLRAMVEGGAFRSDLYYRLNVFEVRVPPLRERLADVPLLAQSFVQRLAARDGRGPPALSSDVLHRLSSHRWPGNIRELQNVLERACGIAGGGQVLVEHLPPTLGLGEGPIPAAPVEPMDMALRRARRAAVDRALAVVGGNRTRAAALLGISVTTLWRALQE